jgi:hypothetical protein
MFYILFLPGFKFRVLKTSRLQLPGANYKL